MYLKLPHFARAKAGILFLLLFILGEPIRPSFWVLRRSQNEVDSLLSPFPSTCWIIQASALASYTTALALTGNRVEEGEEEEESLFPQS